MSATRLYEAHIPSPLPTSLHPIKLLSRFEPPPNSSLNQNQTLNFSLSKLYIDFVENMAQRTEKEETEFKVVPETITLCINNCGVTGNPATNNMCQKCFNATTTTSSGAGILIPPHKFSGGEKSPRSSSSSSRSPERSSDPAETSRNPLTAEAKEATAVKRVVNRCSGCRRKVGLTGFRCRCGDLFCAEHRYSDRHDCSYDYKTAGREAIARENPVVKAAKIVRV